MPSCARLGRLSQAVQAEPGWARLSQAVPGKRKSTNNMLRPKGSGNSNPYCCTSLRGGKASKNPPPACWDPKGLEIPTLTAAPVWEVEKMIRHASQCINRYQARKDGKTAYERMKGKKFTRDVAEFGECVWYYIPGIKGKQKMQQAPGWVSAMNLVRY